MKRFVLVIISSLIAVGVLMMWGKIVKAETAPMTEAHIERIRSNCIEAQSNLTQLHASDGLLRVNRGRLYESISTKLMAPLNSRITLNKLNGGSLVTVTATYEQQLKEFRTRYQQYEESMSKLLKINCQNQPIAFYDGVGETRGKRKLVHDSTVALQKTIQDYKNEFENFAKTFEEKTQ